MYLVICTYTRARTLLLAIVRPIVPLNACNERWLYYFTISAARYNPQTCLKLVLFLWMKRFLLLQSRFYIIAFFSPRADTLNVMTILGALKIHLPLRFAATIHDLFHWWLFSSPRCNYTQTSHSSVEAREASRLHLPYQLLHCRRLARRLFDVSLSRVIHRFRLVS